MRAHIHDGPEHITLQSEARLRPRCQKRAASHVLVAEAAIAAFAFALASPRRCRHHLATENGNATCPNQTSYVHVVYGGSRGGPKRSKRSAGPAARAVPAVSLHKRLQGIRAAN